jgi:hypothetical protein
MKKYALVFFVILFFSAAGLTKVLWKEGSVDAQTSHKDHSGTMSHPKSSSTSQKAPADSHQMHGHKDHLQKAPPISKLKPAEGASVKILSPKEGQAIKGDQVPIHFKIVRGKQGHHVHAYVNGELMGMFESEKGALTGIKPGSHVLELRVVAKDHQTELDARDRVKFMVK